MKKLKRLFADRNAIKNLYAKRIGITVAGAGLVGFSSHAQAQILIQDGFTYAGANSENGHQLSADGSANDGLPTDHNPTGPTYQGLGQANGYNTSETTSGGLSTGNVYNGNGAAMSLGATVPTQLEYSITFVQTDPQGEAGSKFQYASLGFYSTTSASKYTGNSDQYMSAGLAIDSNGNLYTDKAGSLSSAIAFVGTYSLGTTETLTYDLNTATGAFSNISLSGSTANYSTFAPLGPVAANFGGFSVAQTDTQIRVSSFEVSGAVSVPEPSEYALLGSGAVMLGLLRYGRRKFLGS